MVGLFVRLKVTLWRHQVRRGGATSQAWFVVSLLFAFGLGVAGAAGMYAVGVATSGTSALVVFCGLMLTFGWVLFPLTTGQDATIEARNLQLLPLRKREVMPGLAVSAFVGPGAPATLLVLLGTIGFATTSVSAVVAVFGAVATTVAAVLTSRALIAALSAALASRRGRDAAGVGAAVLFVVFYLGSQIAGREVQAVAAQRLGRSLAWIGWLPPCAGGYAILDANRGAVGVAAVRLAIVVVWAAGAYAIWFRVYDVALVAAPATSQRHRRRIDDGNLALFPSLLRRFGTSPAMACVAKELRYRARDPRYRQTALLGIAYAGVLSFSLLVAVKGSLGGNLAGAWLFATFLGLQFAPNLFGCDGAACWAYAMLPDGLAPVVFGASVATALTAVPIVAVAAAVPVMLGRPPATLLVTVPVACGGLFAAIATGCDQSVVAGFAIPSSGNVFGRRSGSRNQNGGRALLGLFFGMVLAAPVLGLAVVGDVVGVGVVGALAGMVWGLLAWRVMARRATRAANRDVPAFVARLSPQA